MGEINWALGMPQGQNPGQAFMEAYDKGNARRKQMSAEEGMRALAVNPNDPEGLKQYAAGDAAGAMNFSQRLREHTATRERAATEERTKVFGRAAKMAKTPQEWDRIATHLSQNGYPEAANMIGKFDPGLRQGYMAAAGESDDSSEQPSAVREYQYRQSLPADQQPGYDRFRTLTAPRIFGSDAGGYNVYDPSAAPPPPQGDMPTVATPQDAMKLPPGTRFRMPDGRIGTVPGGAGGNASGGFPSGSPLDPTLGQR